MIDGLDEANAPGPDNGVDGIANAVARAEANREESPLLFLPRAGDLPEGLHLVLTPRRPGMRSVRTGSPARRRQWARRRPGGSGSTTRTTGHCSCATTGSAARAGATRRRRSACWRRHGRAGTLQRCRKARRVLHHDVADPVGGRRRLAPGRGRAAAAASGDGPSGRKDRPSAGGGADRADERAGDLAVGGRNAALPVRAPRLRPGDLAAHPNGAGALRLAHARAATLLPDAVETSGGAGLRGVGPVGSALEPRPRRHSAPASSASEATSNSPNPSPYGNACGGCWTDSRLYLRLRRRRRGALTRRRVLAGGLCSPR